VKSYEQHYSFSQATSSTSEVYELAFPDQSIIKKFVVQQNGGTAKPFAAVLYNADPSSLSAAAKSKFTIIPEQTALAGNAIGIFQGDYLSVNVEGDPTVSVRKIYLELTATAVDTCTWEVALGASLNTST